jgi:hypothetical protein
MSAELWSTPGFVETARSWVLDQLGPLGHGLTGEWEQPHVRPWSTAIRFESDAGRLWFKANGPGIRFEAALTAELGRLCPDLVPDVLAADGPRGWSLTRDAGPVLRSVFGPDQLWDVWPGLLARYAAAQLSLAEHPDVLLPAASAWSAPPRCPARPEAC